MLYLLSWSKCTNIMASFSLKHLSGLKLELCSAPLALLAVPQAPDNTALYDRSFRSNCFEIALDMVKS